MARGPDIQPRQPDADVAIPDRDDAHLEAIVMRRRVAGDPDGSVAVDRRSSPRGVESRPPLEVKDASAKRAPRSARLSPSISTGAAVSVDVKTGADAHIRPRPHDDLVDASPAPLDVGEHRERPVVACGPGETRTTSSTPETSPPWIVRVTHDRRTREHAVDELTEQPLGSRTAEVHAEVASAHWSNHPARRAGHGSTAETHRSDRIERIEERRHTVASLDLLSTNATTSTNSTIGRTP